MKTAACLAIAVAGSAHADVDTVFTVEFDVTTSTGEIRAEYFGQLPGATTAIGTVWSNTQFELSGDGPLVIESFDVNPGYFSPIFGGPTITGNGTNLVRFVGVQPTPPIGNPDPSNPLRVTDFSYQGSPDQLRMELFGQNTALFLGDPANPFGTVVNYVLVDPPGGVSPLEWRIDVIIIPAPAALGVAPIVLVAARRRRK